MYDSCTPSVTESHKENSIPAEDGVKVDDDDVDCATSGSVWPTHRRVPSSSHHQIRDLHSHRKQNTSIFGSVDLLAETSCPSGRHMVKPLPFPFAFTTPTFSPEVRTNATHARRLYADNTPELCSKAATSSYRRFPQPFETVARGLMTSSPLSFLVKSEVAHSFSHVSMSTTTTTETMSTSGSISGNENRNSTEIRSPIFLPTQVPNTNQRQYKKYSH